MAKKNSKFKVEKNEEIIYEGAANFCVTGSYFHSILGDAVLTDKRFIFKSDKKLTKIDTGLEINLEDIDFVSKTGVPLLTRSLYVSCSKNKGKNYRFNVYSLSKWLKAFEGALNKN